MKIDPLFIKQINTLEDASNLEELYRLERSQYLMSNEIEYVRNAIAEVLNKTALAK